MRHGPVADLIGNILLLFTVPLVVPLAVGVYLGEPGDRVLIAFGLPLLLTLVWGLGLRRVGEGTRDMLRDREAIVAVGLAWFVIPLMGAIPYITSGVLPNPADAYFEAMSGFTTTGSTVIVDVESVPASILLWRAMTQWLGGMGIILLSVVVLAGVMGSSTRLVMRAEMTQMATRLRPRLRETAGLLWGIYSLLTAVSIGLLLAAGLEPLDAVTTGFATLSTGGFAVRNASVQAYGSPVVEAVIFFMMIAGGVNFNLHYQWMRGRPRLLLRDTELRLFLGIIGVSSLVMAADLAWKGVLPLPDALRAAFFNSASVMTTTGFSSADFGRWPMSSQMVLLLLMFIGGCAGSTSGGLKVIRIVVLLKMAQREVRRLLHPRAVLPIIVGGRVMPEELCRSLAVFFFIYIIIFVLLTIPLAYTGLDLLTAVSAVAASLGNVGPGLGALGPAYTYAFLHPAIKLELAFAMWIGRLEIYAGLVLLFPSTYRD